MTDDKKPAKPGPFANASAEWIKERDAHEASKDKPAHREWSVQWMGGSNWDWVFVSKPSGNKEKDLDGIHPIIHTLVEVSALREVELESDIFHKKNLQLQSRIAGLESERIAHLQLIGGQDEQIKELGNTIRDYALELSGVKQDLSDDQFKLVEANKRVKELEQILDFPTKQQLVDEINALVEQRDAAIKTVEDLEIKIYCRCIGYSLVQFCPGTCADCGKPRG